MKRSVRQLNTDWLFLPHDAPPAQAAAPECPEGPFTRVSLPHTNIELPYHHFSEREYCFVSWYRKWFRLPLLRGRRVFVDFDGVMIAATVFVNGRQAGPEHKGGYTPFSLDITDLLLPGRNVLAVRVDSHERPDIPPFGKVVDYLTFGGIYREVRLRLVDPLHIEHLFARAGDVLAERKWLGITARLANTTTTSSTVKLTAELRDATGNVVGETRTRAAVPAGAELDVQLSLEGLEGVRLWELDDPHLYTLSVELSNGDVLSTRVGFRSAEFREDGAFYLNDRALKLRGLNRHQTYPYIGAAAPSRLQRKDAEILKNDLACNIVRTSHYPQSPHFLDRCDELGLLVLEEIAGWQHIGDTAWQELSLRDLQAMIVRDRNHPSIILWGVRINESQDNHDFYTRTNALARQLDPTRQTGGIRCMWNSELLEDVYTQNDFNYDLRPPAAPRYLNTEFCGHMYPTKSFDQEERVKQHALHHAHVHNQIGAMKSAGGIGWCAFDYNTHANFGSGDRICYHGVMDIFRQPKFAAGFYAAQVDPTRKIVLEPASYGKMGDKSGAGIAPLVIFSNVEEVEIFVGEQSRGRFRPDRQSYPNLPHPPFIIADIGGLWGGDWLPVTIVGYIAGKKAAQRTIANDGVPMELSLTADDAHLLADGADMTRLSLRITDAFGNVLPFAMQPVSLSLRGPGTLVGDNPFPMPGGRGAVYLRATRRPGAITVTATTARMPAQHVVVQALPVARRQTERPWSCLTRRKQD